MTRFLTGNVWIDGVFYPDGMSDDEVGDVASRIGDHLWRKVGSGQPEPTPAPPVVEQSFAQEEVGESAFAPAPPPSPAPDAVKPPPRSGKGSSAAAWLAYATAHQVDVHAEAERHEIIAALDDAGIPTE